MTKEEIIEQFQGNSENPSIVYTFNGTTQQLRDLMTVSYTLMTVNGVVYFTTIEGVFTPTDSRIEVL